MIDSLLTHLKKKMKKKEGELRIYTGKVRRFKWRFRTRRLGGKELRPRPEEFNFRSSAPRTKSEICSRPVQCTPLGMYWRHDRWQERHQEARERRVKQGIFIPTTMQ